MPESLKKDIESAESKAEVYFLFKQYLLGLLYLFIYFQHTVVWVTCEGENPADIENIGPLRYIPQKGFTSEFFPFLNQDGYLSPLVAVHFENPKRK